MGEFSLEARRELSRFNFKRPQAMIWSGLKFKYDSTALAYIPPTDASEEMLDIMILPDHGRSAIQIGKNRIESRARMINGTSRSYWTADKVTISTSWENLPSRLSTYGSQFSNGMQYPDGDIFLADNAAPASMIKLWYDKYVEPFYVYLSYDDGAGSGIDENGKVIGRYVEERLMHFTDFKYTLTKRGIYDLWDISVSLEES